MSRGRILFVEDDRTQREKTAEWLRCKQWTVETAQNGREALEKLRSRASKYHLIVLDLRMPELSGEQLLECLQDDGLDVPPIIVLSAYAENNVLKCRYLGASLVLKKPYDPLDFDRLAPAAMVAAQLGDDVLDPYGFSRKQEYFNKSQVKQPQVAG